MQEINLLIVALGLEIHENQPLTVEFFSGASCLSIQKEKKTERGKKKKVKKIKNKKRKQVQPLRNVARKGRVCTKISGY